MGGRGSQALPFGLAFWSSSLLCKYPCMCLWSANPYLHVQEAGESCQWPPLSLPAFCSAKQSESLRGGVGRQKCPSSEEKMVQQGGDKEEGPGRGKVGEAGWPIKLCYEVLLVLPSVHRQCGF